MRASAYHLIVRENKLMGIAFMIIGGFMLFTAVVSLWNTTQFVTSARRAGGIVRELNHGPAHPQIEFKLPSGESEEFPGTGWISYRKGQRAEVLYTLDEQGVSETHLNDAGDLWYSAVSRAGMGLVFLIIGAVLRWRSAGP